MSGRVTAPLGRRAVTVTQREEHGAYVVIRCADPDGPPPQPGQFYMLSTASRWGGGEAERPFLPRAFSVLRCCEHGRGRLELHFLIEDVGPGTKRLCELAPGDDLLIVGPLGSGFAPPRERRQPLLVGGGVGIAPLAVLQDSLRDSPPPLLGFRDAARAIGARLLRDPTIATDDGSVGHHGLVTELLDRALGLEQSVEVYACGPPPMLEAVRTLCAQRGVPAQLALESGMACGYGACFGCVVPTRHGYLRLCIEGPVLDARELGSGALVEVGH